MDIEYLALVILILYFFLYSTRVSFMDPRRESMQMHSLLLVHEGHSSFPSTCITVSARLGVHARCDQSRLP